MSRQRAGTWWFGGTLALSLLLMLVPLPDVLEPCKPYWPALVLLYWTLESEGRVTLGLAFALGLLADVLVGVVLGEQALRLCALVFIATHFRARLRLFPMWQLTFAVLALLVNDRLLLLIVRVLSGGSLPPPSWWLSPLIGAALWPFVFLLLDDVRVRARIQ
jgi:rod shape-determining protein MreD